MTLRFTWILFCISFLAYFTVVAQNKQLVDSLSKVVSNTKTHDTILVAAYNDLGVQYATSNNKLAKSYIKTALHIANKNKMPNGVAGANNCLGIVYYYQKEYDSALVYLKKAYEINKAIDRKWGQASALHQMGAVHNHLNNYEKAIKSFKQASEIFLSFNDTVSYAKSIENIGFSYSLMEHNEKALKYYLKSISLYEKLKNYSGIARGNIHLSSILLKQKEYKKALEYLQAVLPNIEKQGNNRHIRALHCNTGICYMRLKMFPKALSHLEKALEYQKENTIITAKTQSLIGSVYYEMENYKQGLNFQKKAMLNYSVKGDRTKKIIAYNNYAIAKSYLKLCRLDSAEYYANKALSLSKTIQNLKYEKEVNHTLALIAEHKGNHLDACMYFKTSTKLRDSLETINNKKNLSELHVKYETQKKEEQLSTIKQYYQAINNQKIFLIVGLVICIVVLGGGFLFFKKKINFHCLEKTKLSNELAEKQKELTTNSLHLAKKNKVLENIKDEVKHIKYSKNKNARYNYEKLIQTIDFDLKDDVSWENFRKHFEQVHKDFYSNIKKKFPNITSNELRLMALLKLNLSSKEIGRILNITQEGVRKARYRLRKKLEIDSNDKLMNVIMNI